MAGNSLDQLEAQRLLQQLRAGQIDEGHIASALHALGEADLLEAQPDVERFLTSPDELIRHMALHVLTLHFGLQTHWQTAVDFLLHDPVHTRRRDGASALGWLKRDTGDQQSLKLLAQVVRNEEEEISVREAAYSAMREIVHYDSVEQSRLLDLSWDLEKDADWRFIDLYLS